MSTWPSTAVSTGPVAVWICGTVPPGGRRATGHGDRAHTLTPIMHAPSEAPAAGRAAQILLLDGRIRRHPRNSAVRITQSNRRTGPGPPGARPVGPEGERGGR